MAVFEFLMNEILSLPEVLVGLIVMIGLILQRAEIARIFTGTVKSIIGFLILGAGAAVIVESLDSLGGIIQDRFNIQGVIPNNEAIVGVAQQTLGAETALIMGFGFIANILFAKFTPFKYIFLTGHHTFFMAALLSATLAASGMSGAPLVITGTIILGALMVLVPAMAQPFMRQVTGGNDVAIGHFGTLGYVSAGLVGKAIGNKEKSTEEMEIPEKWSFLRDSLVSTALTMIVMFLILVLVAGPDVVGEYAGDQNYIMFGLMQGITFAAGFSIIMAGVRMILTEIVPAFKGIAEKLVPGAKPALDVPIVFPYAPTAVIIGFISSFIGGLIGMFMLGIFSLALIIPGLVPHFFTGAGAGVFGNATGGRIGAAAGGFVNGILISFIPAFLLPVLGDLGFQNTTFGDSDFGVVGILVSFFANLFGG
ncbi:PTS ascorbate transporter subunit IIC [Salisediminibacterium halotolerans]|uniref:Ascorbate-specific PTS system EIIC component n=1 Tax=Salisediminibacterium halotolerans TaxID=517425 RepID=A0A1H9W9B3_9BACI|nr:PTS ascorbate transporter subunit IIC [Salisediminibacterium haloalkalitolerans]SES30512.1 PTS system, ascorbate-specific IIC component [Salisediminibacterium haloalkalitolerans]